MSKVEGFRFTVVEEDGDEVTVEVSEEDYEREKAAGVEEEFLLKPGRHKFIRGGFQKRHPEFKAENLHPSKIKVGISIKLDLDVLNYFKARAAEPGAPSYEIQINRVLREFMESEGELPDYSRLIDDERFIGAVADRVKDHLVKND